jgi:hypothetical protein
MYPYHTKGAASEEAKGNFRANTDPKCPDGSYVVYHLHKDAAHKEQVHNHRGSGSALGQITIINTGTTPASLATTIDIPENAVGSGGVCGTGSETIMRKGTSRRRAMVSGIARVLQAIAGP